VWGTALFSTGIYFSGYIYAIGGKTNENVNTKLCERYDIENDKWENIASLNHARSRPGVCAFGDNNLYAFFGTASSGLVLPDIEVYDIAQN
jgi:hypothetical protein